MGDFAKDRQKKYEISLNAYEKYVAKENEVLKNNIKHC